MDKLHDDYKKSLMADFNSNYDRDIEHGKELDKQEENKVKAKLTGEKVAKILSRPNEKASVLRNPELIKLMPIIPQLEGEPIEALLSETMDFEARLFELATVHNKNITITIEIN